MTISDLFVDCQLLILFVLPIFIRV